MTIPGGNSAVKDISECDPASKLQEKVASLKSHAEAKLGETFTKFEGVQFRSQVVAGTIYHVKVLVSDDDAVHMKILEHLPFENKPLEILNIKKAKKGDELAIMNH